MQAIKRRDVAGAAAYDPAFLSRARFLTSRAEDPAREEERMSSKQSAMEEPPAGLTTLDHLLENAATNVWREVRGALNADDLNAAVDEFVALNAYRPQSQSPAGPRAPLFGRSLEAGRSHGDPARLRWYWAGAVTGFARKEDWAAIVSASDREQVVREFGAGRNSAATTAVSAIVKAFRQQGRSDELGGLLRKEAVAVVPDLFASLLDAATDLLRGLQTGEALALYELLMDAAEGMESTGASPPPRALNDTRRRAAHCLRLFHEHRRARDLLEVLLEEDDDPNIRAMIEADLGLLDGEFRNMGDVELPLRKKHLDDFLGRLVRGEERFKRSADADVPYSAHGNYLLGVLRSDAGE